MRPTLTAAYDETVLESLSLTFLSGSRLAWPMSNPAAISQSHSNGTSDPERNVELEEPTTVPSFAAVSAKR